MQSDNGTRLVQSGKKDDEERETMLGVSAPKDSYNAVYLIILLNGMGVLMPWNMFITIAPAYYADYKLVEIGPDGQPHATPYSLNVLNYLGVCAQVPNLLMNVINLFVQIRGGLTRRIGFSLIIIAIICLITLVFTLINTSHMITAFFFFTMLLVIILNAATGVYQNSLYGLIAAFPPQYTNAVVLGNNVCGTFVSVISIITLVVSSDVKIAAFLYFLISLLMIIACFFSFFILPKLHFYNYYMSKKDDNDKQGGSESSDTKWNLYLEVFKKIWIQCFNIFLVFFVTLTVFPSVEAEIKVLLKNGKYDFIVPEYLFTPVTTFLIFNLFAAFGSFLANYCQWPSPKFLVVPVVARLVFIPLMMFCNFRPSLRTWPVWIENEWIYIALAIVMAFTSGYFSSVGMMYAPKSVQPSKASVAGMMAAFFLVFGICSGVVFTLFVSWFIENAGPNQPQVHV